MTNMSFNTHMLDVMRKSLNKFKAITKKMATNGYRRFNFFFLKFIESLLKRYPEVIHRRVSINQIRWELSKLYHLNKQESRTFLKCLNQSEYGLFLDSNRQGLKLSEEVVTV